MNDSNQKPHKIYQIHRENQRERILEAAEMLFIRDGIDNISIGAPVTGKGLASNQNKL